MYPALSIGKALKAINSSILVEFVGSPFGLEDRVIEREGFKLHRISVGKLNVGNIEKIKTLILLPIALLKAFFLILLSKPDAVIGVGGYVSGPVMIMASIMRKKTFLWEPNAYPGMANRLLSSWVDECLVVFEESKSHMKGKSYKMVNIPVRPEIENLGPRVPESADFRILIFGGSQGARAINNVILGAIKKDKSWFGQVEMVHQTGAVDFDRVKTEYASIPETQGRVSCHKYLNDMPLRYQWADLVICRAGASTLAELAACGKAALLIPLPTAADEHQRKNAEALASRGAAKVLLQTELTPETLIKEIKELKDSPDKILEIEKSISYFHKPRAAETIANLILDSMKEGS